MRKQFLQVLASLVAMAACDAAARSKSARAEFQRLHPCPATQRHRGPCPGHVVDHIVPLCAGGADAAANMQWQTVDQAAEKDVHEHRQCRLIRRAPLP